MLVSDYTDNDNRVEIDGPDSARIRREHEVRGRTKEDAYAVLFFRSAIRRRIATQ